MNRRISFLGFLLSVITGIAATAMAGTPSKLVDRVAVTVGNRAITESRVLEELRVTAFLNTEMPKLDAATRRAAADRLVERILMRREIELTGFIDNSAEASKEELEGIRGRFLDEAAFNAALAEAGITEAQLRESLAEQTRLLTFIDYRFRPAVTVSEEQAREFYKAEYPAFWTSLHPGEPRPEFDDARDDVERLLIDRQVDKQMDEWLAATREVTRVVYRDEVFK